MDLSPADNQALAVPDAMRLRALVPTFAARLPDLIGEVIELLQADWPDYAHTLSREAIENFALARIALEHLVTLAETPELGTSSPLLPPGSLFEEIGRTEWREGRALDMLLSAYRAGARVAWRHISEVAVRRGLDTADVARLAEAVFVFVEELSTASTRGYVDEQRASAAERDRLRGQLAELLVSDRADTTVVSAIALRAGWPLPATAALVLADASAEEAIAQVYRIDAPTLPVRTTTSAGAIVADADAPGRRASLVTLLAGCGAVVGPTVPLHELPASLRVTEAALRLSMAGALTDDPVFVADHLDDVIVGRDPWLLDRLRSTALAPLAEVPDGTRERLAATLGTWLAAMGDQQATARALNVHPQTVRYRLRQLAEHFGPALSDPDARLQLMLALCWPRRP